jgi:hypothetical protein
VAKKGKTKSKLPKSVGGVAIPKKWRTAAEKLAENPVVLDVVAAGLLAAAAALTAPRETAAAASAAGDEANKAATTSRIMGLSASFSAALRHDLGMATPSTDFSSFAFFLLFFATVRSFRSRLARR